MARKSKKTRRAKRLKCPTVTVRCREVKGVKKCAIKVGKTSHGKNLSQEELNGRLGKLKAKLGKKTVMVVTKQPCPVKVVFTGKGAKAATVTAPSLAERLKAFKQSKAAHTSYLIKNMYGAQYK